MINKIEHLGIAVKSLKDSNEIMRKLLGTAAYKEELVTSEHVLTSFFALGSSKIELLEAVDGLGPIQKFIEKRGEGIHHIALDVTDIEGEMERLQGLGFELLNHRPKAGADGKKIAFLHPRSTNGILIELCEDMVPKTEL